MDNLEELKRRGTKPGEWSFDTEIDSEVVGWAADEIERLNAALQDARQALTNITAVSNLDLAQTTARVALGIIANQQPTQAREADATAATQSPPEAANKSRSRP
jgi:hypothetical protein